MLPLALLKTLATGPGRNRLRIILTEGPYYNLNLVLHFDRTLTFINYIVEPKVDGLSEVFSTREFYSAVSMYERSETAIELALKSGLTIQQIIDSNAKP